METGVADKRKSSQKMTSCRICLRLLSRYNEIFDDIFSPIFSKVNVNWKVSGDDNNEDFVDLVKRFQTSILFSRGIWFPERTVQNFSANNWCLRNECGPSVDESN